MPNESTKVVAGREIELAKAFYRKNPTASISQVAQALGISPRTIARARKKMIEDGIVQPGRAAKTEIPLVPERAAPSEAIAEAVSGKITDAKALETIADLEDLAHEDFNDEEVQAQLLRNVRRLAFNTKLHPDTRMSATTLWLKLKDMARADALGPGKPLTHEAAVARLHDLHVAVGVELAVEALLKAHEANLVLATLYKYFDVEAPDAKASSDADQTTRGASEAPSATGHEDHPTSDEGVR